ncbi:MAG TPA: adenylate/guanylate cyclase domain-containing protein [bacterium]|nr:adenylate/guanylate cyclase domain-containing protein [bacterium]
MFYGDFKEHKELSKLLNDFGDFYFQDKNNSVLETLFKICDYVENAIQLPKLNADLKRLYCFILQAIGDYYPVVLDSHKGLRFFKEKILKYKSMQFFDYDIFMAVYIKVGELYLEVDNKSKASECLSICVSYSIEKKTSSPLIEFLNSLMLANLDQKSKGIINLINLLNARDENSVFDFYFKNKIICCLKKLIPQPNYEEMLFPILNSKLKEFYDESLNAINKSEFHKALFLLKYALNYADEVQKNKLAVDFFPYIAYEKAKFLFRFGFHKLSKELLERVIQYIDTEKIHQDLLFDYYMMLIQVSQYMKNYSYAFQIIANAEKNPDIMKYNEKKICLFFEKALCKSKFGDDNESLALFNEIENNFLPNIKEKKFSDIFKVKINNERSFILSKNYEFKQAFDLYVKSFAVIKAYPQSDEYGETIRGIAGVIQLNENGGEALKFMQESLELFGKIHNINQRIITMKNIAKYYIRTGDLNESLYYLDESIRLLEIREDFQELPLLYSQKAKLFLMQDNYSKAEEFFKKDLNITKQTDNIHSLAFSYFHLGITFQKQNLNSVAESHLKKSLEYFNIIDNVNNKIPVMLQLAINNAKCGIPKLALKYIADAEDGWRITKDRILQAKISLTKGVCYNYLGKRGDNIENLFKSAIKILKNIDPLHFDLIDAYFELAMYYEKTNNLRESVENIKKSIELSEKIGLSEKVNHLLKRLSEISLIESQKFRMKTLTGSDSTELIDSEDNLKVSEKYLTIFFIDIRGFTTISEQLDIAKLQSFLNDFYSSVTKVISANKGIVNKFIGDSVLALFNINSDDEQNEENAIKSAKEIINRISSVNQRRKNSGEAMINVGIGINSGNVLLGSFGSLQRIDYTAIGDNVNLAARLQSIAGKGEILISESTYSKVKDKFKIEFVEETTVKGKLEKVKIYRVLY